MTSVSTAPAPDASTQSLVDEDATKQIAPNPGFELVPGTSLGEYTIETKISEGGMGTVFAAVHPVIGKRAAVKVLKNELCADPASVARFVDEARVVNQIQHPNIVDIFAFGEMSDGRSYFVMEWLSGETLHERIARGPLTPLELYDVLRPLCRALQAAHEKGVIHRDLKPANIFLAEVRDEAPRVKLLDFGVAKLVHRDSRIEKTVTGAMIGTPQYIAPEQAKGRAIDHRVDIYSLGAIAFELLTGRPPFVADNSMELVAKHLMEPPPRVSDLMSGVPREIDELVFAMLSKNADDRPSLAEIAATFERLSQQPTRDAVLTSIPAARGTVSSNQLTAERTAASAGMIEPQRPRRRGTKVVLGVCGAIAAFAIAFFVVSALGGDEPKRESSRTPPTEPPPAVNVAPAAVEAPPPSVENAQAPLDAPKPTDAPATPPSPATSSPATPAIDRAKKPEPVKHSPGHKPKRPSPPSAPQLPADDTGLAAPGAFKGHR